jgi:hypothetical protein
MDENGSVALISAIAAAAAVVQTAMNSSDLPAFASAFSVCALAVALVILVWRTSGRT